MKADDDLAHHFVRAQIDDRNRTFAGDVTDGIDAHQRPASRRSRHAVGVRTAAAPVAHVGFFAREHHVVRRNAHIPQAKHSSVPRVQFGETIRQIQRDVKPPAIGGNSES